jgi:hypothetical protein
VGTVVDVKGSRTLAMKADRATPLVGGSSPSPEHVDLDLPADPGILSLVRLTVGVVGAQADFGLEDLDDLRLAVEELCLSLWRSTSAQPERLRFRFVWDDDCVEVRCAVIPRKPDAIPRDDAFAELGERLAGLPADLSQQILDALVDEHGISGRGSDVRGWIRKHRSPLASPT